MKRLIVLSAILLSVLSASTVVFGDEDNGPSQFFEDQTLPKIIILMDERIIRKRNRPGFTIAESKIIEYMSQFGFSFYDKFLLRSLMKKKQTYMRKVVRGMLTKESRNFIKNNLGIDVLIVGNVKARDQSIALRQFSKTMCSANAIITFKAIDVKTGKILTMATNQGSGVFINKQAAAAKAIDRTVRKMFTLKDRSNDKLRPSQLVHDMVTRYNSGLDK